MATPHSSRIEELLPAYALGALDGEDLRELEEHLAGGCAECRGQIDLWQRDLEALADSVAPVEPSEMTRARVLRLTGAAPAPRRIPGWLAFAAAALLLLAVWGAAGQIRMGGEVRRLTAERARLATRVEALGREVDQARAEARRAARALQVLAAPGVQSVVLAGLGPAPGAAGHTYVNPRTRDALFYAFDRTVDARDIQAWAVTIEPPGGVPQPTGEMVLMGEAS